jgi:outer membrane protein OmpA-like peptidoglycan-associated protein/ABC-type taurine transport system substrate-binding protein
MKKRIIGAVLLLVLALVLIVSVWFLMPYLLDWRQTDTSDASKLKTKIRIAVDNWIGYFPLCSPEMKSAMRQSGYLLVCEDDSADYPGRMKKLKSGEIDFAVATIDSYLLNAAPFSFPATIVMVIDESKGGDAILARQETVASLGDINSKSDVRVAFTPGSPSHYLLKAAADHFNVPGLLPSSGSRRIETDGSEKAKEKLLTGAADVAVLWEPDVSKALEHEGIKKILGTEDTEKLIVDILLVNREFSQKSPQVVKQLLADYFQILKRYRDGPELFLKHVKKETGLSDDKVSLMLQGVHWSSFTENTDKWFGISLPGIFVEEGILETIDATVKVLMTAGDFSQNPVPDKNPYRLINSSFLEELFAGGMSGFTIPGGNVNSSVTAGSLEARFSQLDENGWSSLKEIGTLRMDPVIFQQGSHALSVTAKQVIDNGVERLKHYPHFRVVVRGHTGTRGDHQENAKLSRLRAEAVVRYMTITYGIDDNRLKIEGRGGEMPLPKKAGESERTYQYRLPRVELSLLREDI